MANFSAITNRKKKEYFSENLFNLKVADCLSLKFFARQSDQALICYFFLNANIKFLPSDVQSMILFH